MSKNHTLSEVQRFEVLTLALDLAHRTGIAPQSISVYDDGWRKRPQVYVTWTIPANDLKPSDGEDRAIALARVATHMAGLRNLGKVDKTSSDYAYTLDHTEVVTIAGEDEPIEVELTFTVSMSVDMVCTVTPKLDENGEPVTEEYEASEPTYHTVVKTRVVTEKICPPSLLTVLQ